MADALAFELFEHERENHNNERLWDLTIKYSNHYNSISYETVDDCLDVVLQRPDFENKFVKGKGLVDESEKVTICEEMTLSSKNSRHRETIMCITDPAGKEAILATHENGDPKVFDLYPNLMETALSFQFNREEMGLEHIKRKEIVRTKKTKSKNYSIGR